MHSLTVGRGGRRNAATEPPSTAVSPPTSPGRGLTHGARSFKDMMEPAVDGPPSPERIRALSRQFRQTSVAEKHHSASSASSSWEQGLDDPHQLSRRSSQRSTSSGVPPRDRPESVVVFGKSIFSRKGKQRRDVTDPNPSSNALFPPGMAAEPMPPTRERGSVSAMFSRRKSAKAADVEAAQRKLQISGPYNFQHLTHTQKDNLPNLERTSRNDLVSEFSCIRAGQRPSHGSLKGISADNIDYQRLSSELLEIRGFEPELDQSQLQQDDHPYIPSDDERSSSRVGGAFLPSIRPLSSLEENLLAGALPPRVSSRASARLDGPSLFPPMDQDRLAPLPGPPRRQSEPHISYTSSKAAHNDSSDYARAITTPEEGSWPLMASAMTSVPELPEEDEVPLSPRQQPPEPPQNKPKSLRGSISTPALHQLAMAQAAASQQSPTQQAPSQNALPQRAPSNASDTLGEYSSLPVRRTRAGTNNHPMPPIPDYDNWEDDIDYCYEHAAEADCDFSWEGHEPETHEPEHEHGHGHSDFRNVDYRISLVQSPGSFSPRAVSPGATEATNAAGAVAAAARVRSPAGSRMSRSGTATPGITSNFSLPQRAHNRTLSRSSSFGESQARGFSMSPTFFISAEFGENSNSSHHHQNQQQQQRQAPTYEEQEQERGPRYTDSYNYDYEEDDDDDEDFLTHLPRNESGLSAMDRKTALLHARSSASTDVSAYSDHSLASSRHKSNGSMNTALTRWTASSACASLDGWQAMGPGEASTSASAGQRQSQPGVPLIVNEEQRAPASENDFFEPTSPVSPTTTTSHSHERHRSDADLLTKASASATPPNAPGVAVPTTPKEASDPPKTRRRARTTSRSHNSPQLALFPHIPSAATARRPSAF